MIIGNIPETLVAIHQEGDENAFISDSTNPNTIRTGMDWARYYYKPGTNLSSRAPTILQTPLLNTPRTGYTITGFEHRREGGVAWKVLTPDRYMVDLREDVLLEIILSGGIAEGGRIIPELIWAIVGSQMKLICYGSHTMKVIQEYMVNKQKPKIRKKDLVPGTVYSSPTGKVVVYLGMVEYDRFDTVPTNIKSYSSSAKTMSLVYVGTEKYPMWYNLTSVKPQMNSWDALLSESLLYSYMGSRTEFSKTKTLNNTLGKITTPIPEIIRQIRDHNWNQLESKENAEKHHTFTINGINRTLTEQEYLTFLYSVHLTVRPVGYLGYTENEKITKLREYCTSY